MWTWEEEIYWETQFTGLCLYLPFVGEIIQNEWLNVKYPDIYNYLCP